MPADDAADKTGGDDQNDQQRIMDADREIGVTERFEYGNLLALRADRPAHDDIQQKSSDANEDCGKDLRAPPEGFELLIQEAMRDLVLAGVSAETAVTLDDRIDTCDDIAHLGIRAKRHDTIVKRPIHIIRLAECLAPHPEDAVTFEIRGCRIGPHDLHELR